jgi:hypothetical protein
VKLTGAAIWFSGFNVLAGGPGSLPERSALSAAPRYLWVNLHGSGILQEVWPGTGILGAMVSRLRHAPWEIRPLPILRE